MSSSKNLRRSLRIQASTKKKYAEDSDEEMYSDQSSQSSTMQTAIEEQLEEVEENAQKPLELFSEKDISGAKLFTIYTSPKKDGMMQKAKQCHTPQTPKSFRTLPVLKIVLEKIMASPEYEEDGTEKVTRKQFLPNVDSSGNESVSENSEYVPNSESTSESDGEDPKDSEDSEDSEIFNARGKENNARTRVRYRIVQNTPKSKVQNTPTRASTRRTSVAHKAYHMKTDEYFESQSEKAITSNHTLGRLRNPRLTEQTLKELLTNENYVSEAHKTCICNLTENYKSFFPMWQFIMEEGYNLLLYGLGSKRNLINDFHREIIADHPTVIINGFFPSLSIKDIFSNIMDLLNLHCPANSLECCQLIETVMRENPSDRLYLIIHNVDGAILRSNKSQHHFAHLAAIPNVRIIASVDHVNAPLLWDHTMCAKFNFYWWDATTFLPYRAETANEDSLLVQQSGAFALSSLKNVFLSLTSNTRAIYLILVRYQLDNNSKNFRGMPFKDLYRAGREQFLVSSDLALRAQLTEFIDHKLAQVKRMVDGAEHVAIPLEKDLLKQFLEEYGSEING